MFRNLDPVLSFPPVLLPCWCAAGCVGLHVVAPHHARVADDAKVPMVVLVYGHHHEVLLKDIHLPSPSLSQLFLHTTFSLQFYYEIINKNQWVFLLFAYLL